MRYPFSVAGPASFGMFAIVGLVGALSAVFVSPIDGFVVAAVVHLACGQLREVLRRRFMRRRSIAAAELVRTSRPAHWIGAISVAISLGPVVALEWRPAWIAVLFAASSFAGESYLRRQWAKAGNPGDPRAAINWSPETNPAYDFRAVSAYRRGDYEEAISLCRRALEADPTNGRLLYNLAVTETQIGEWDEALQHLREAGNDDPALINRAWKDPDFASIRDDPRFPVAESP